MPLIVVTLVVAGCVGGPARKADIKGGVDEHFVRDIGLSETRGEIGKPFKAEVTYETNYLNDPEWDVTGVPPGLSFDEKARAIVGTPKNDGFFTVNINLRKKVDRKDSRHKPRPDERWWSGTVRIDVFKPVE